VHEDLIAREPVFKVSLELRHLNDIRQRLLGAEALNQRLLSLQELPVLDVPCDVLDVCH
jgi:hypothetical protein